MKVVVVGAGIGGLVAAWSVQQAGHDVEIVERATELAEIGAGLSLWPNAQAALDAVGLGEAVGGVGEVLEEGTLRSREGRPTVVWSAAEAEAMGGYPLLVHRGELQQVLLQACREIPIRLGSPVVRVAGDAAGAVAVTAGGAEIGGDLVVGADGIRSVARRAVLEDRLRYSGLTSWRAVIDRPLPGRSWLAAWRGRQFLATGVRGGRTYVAGLLPAGEGVNATWPALGPVLHEAFEGWWGEVGALIDAVPDGSWFRDDVYHRPPPARLHAGRIVLVGDAAHPMTPDLGQGGCQAVEDAVVLGRCLADSGRPVADSLAAYERLRLPRVRRVVRASRSLGVVMAATNPAADAARAVGTRLTPAFLRRRQLASVAGRHAFTGPLAAHRPAAGPVR